MNTYPLFTPPEHLAQTGSKAWKKKEVKEYFEWFLGVKASRVSGFLSFFNFELTADFDEDLQIISRLLFEKIDTTEFYSFREPDKIKKLNDRGMAMAADMGLLIAEALETKKPSLFWDIGKGPRSYHSYNLPVLKEFSNGEWDLVFAAISKVGYSLNELRSPYNWPAFYSDLRSKAL